MSQSYLKTLVQTDKNGVVQQTLLDVAPYNYSTDAFSYPNDPVIIDNNIADLYYKKTRIEDGVAVTEDVRIHPYTEQILSGNVYGGFQLNEQVYQTPVNVEVVNYLTINGQTANSYNPVISNVCLGDVVPDGIVNELDLAEVLANWGPCFSCPADINKDGYVDGEDLAYVITGWGLCRRAARFFGTFRDLPGGKGAGLKLPKIDTSTFYRFMVEGFVYFDSLPKTYDPILISRAVDGIGGSTQDSFSIEYSVADRQLLLKYNRGVDGSIAPGFAETLRMSPQDGLTTGKWHHFAFSMGITRGVGSGNTVGVATFFDGSRVSYKQTAFSPNILDDPPNPTIRNSTAPIMIGCGLSGERPFKGYLDSVLISGGRSVSALRGYYPEFSTITVPEKEKISVGEFTVYHLNMNGPVGTSLFPCDVPNRMISTASYISEKDGKLGVSLISRQVSQINSISLNGLTLFNGVSYGHAIVGAGAAPCFGKNSGSCIIVSDVEQLHGVDRARNIRRNAAEFTISYLLGSTAMRGVSGASGDFRRFFSKSWGGDTFSYLPTQTNTTELNYIYDTVVESGRTGVFYVKDYSSGAVYGVQTADVQNLYGDVVEYHSLCGRLGISASGRMSNLGDMESIYSAKGFEDESIVRRIAPRMDNVGILYINNYGRMNQTTTRPELIYDPYDVQGISFDTIAQLPGSPLPTAPVPY